MSKRIKQGHPGIGKSNVLRDSVGRWRWLWWRITGKVRVIRLKKSNASDLSGIPKL